MSFESLLIAHTLAQPTITSLVNNRIYPQLAPQGTVTPYVTYSLVSLTSKHTTTIKALDDFRIQFSVFTADYKLALDIRDAFVAVYDGFSSEIGTTKVLSFLDVVTATYEQDTKLHHISCDFLFSVVA